MLLKVYARLILLEYNEFILMRTVSNNSFVDTLGTYMYH